VGARHEEPATVEQLAAAMDALGFYTGSNEDRVLVTRAADHLLLEGEPRLTVSVDPGSGSLTTRIRLHRYVAFIGGRVPSATGVLNGTGLATPVFA
jgi:hypothetical protein